MVEGYCKAPKEYAEVKWPDKFVEVPRVGDYVRSMDEKLTLKVKAVTHIGVGVLNNGGYRNSNPVVEIDLRQ